ncbi:rhodanese-like domain-containing protein [Bacteroidia bacterium]|nr:rhodanese-like domain-containing protein [Bacteroidia bacterium]
MLGFIKRLFGPGVDLAQLMKEGAVIVDVRSSGEYRAGHVKGSVNIPLDDVKSELETIKRWNKPVVTCCASGMRSGSAASLLKRNGVDAYNAGPWQKADRLI